MKREPQIFNRLQAQDEPIPTEVLDIMKDIPLREFVRRIMKKSLVEVPLGDIEH